MKETSYTAQIYKLLESLPYDCAPKDAVDRLREFPRDEALAYLRELTLTHEDAIFARAIDAILQLDRDFGKAVLLELWNRPIFEWFFCYSAVEFGDDSFVAPLCQILRNSQTPTARYMAAVALERWGNLMAVEALVQALNDPGTDHEGRMINKQAEYALKAIEQRMNK